MKMGEPQRLLDLRVNIRQMAEGMVKEDGQIDKHDVKDLLRRATAGGKLDRKCAEDLVWVRERFADRFTSAALEVMNSVVGAFVDEEIKRMKEADRRRKIDRQLLAIEESIEWTKMDRKLRDMEVDTRQRFMITNLFGQRKRRTGV